MYSNNTPLIQQDSEYSNPFTFDFEHVSDVLNYGVVAFAPWARLCCFLKTLQDSAYAL